MILKLIKKIIFSLSKSLLQDAMEVLQIKKAQASLLQSAMDSLTHTASHDLFQIATVKLRSTDTRLIRTPRY